MGSIKVLVVEDEVIIADTIVDAINDFGYEALEPAITYTEAIETIENQKPDIGIFDIQLSGSKTGVDLAKVVQEKYKFPIIFLTSNSDKLTLSEAKLTAPSAFLVKPFNTEELYAAIELALYNYSQQNTKEIESLNILIKEALFLKQKDCYKRIDFSDILYIKSDNVYLDFNLTNGDIITVRGTLGDYLDKLTSKFVRSHRSYIINTSHLQSIQNTTVTLQKIALPISKGMRGILLGDLHHD